MPFPALLRTRLEAHLAFIYPRCDASELAQRVLEAFWPDGLKPRLSSWKSAKADSIIHSALSSYGFGQ